MSTPEHLDGYQAIAGSFKSAVGKTLVSYVVVGVDERGEVYSGACHPRGADGKALLRSLVQRMAFVTSQCKEVA